MSYRVSLSSKYTDISRFGSVDRVTLAFFDKSECVRTRGLVCASQVSGIVRIPQNNHSFELSDKEGFGLKVIQKLLLVLVLIALILVALAWYYLYVPPPVEIALPGQYKNESISSNGLDRSFSYYLPATIQDDGALIFILHGSMSSGDQMRTMTGYEFDQLAESNHYIPVYADGFENHWNDCRASADYSANIQNIDDIAYLRQLVALFTERHNIDPNKVYITGHSNGGHMAYRAALEAPEMVAAIAPISANLPMDENLGCEKSGAPVAVALFIGTEDPVNPYEGGLVGLMGNTSRGVVLSATATASYWSDLAGAATAPSKVIAFPEADGVASTSVTAKYWAGTNGVEVRLYTLEGAGHVIPSKRTRFPRILGPGAGDISGPEEIVSFFEAVARK